MTTVKRKVSVTLDADLVIELGAGEEACSKQVNDALRDVLERRRRRRLCGAALPRRAIAWRSLERRATSALSVDGSAR